jgi:hypothetical protein
MFRPVFERVRGALKTQDLLPTHDGAFMPAGRARLARGADLRTLFSREQLGALTNAGEVRWLAGAITQDCTPELGSYLCEELQVPVIAPSDVLARVTPAFLKPQPDDWLVRFYDFLAGQKALQQQARKKAIIRCEGGTHVAAFRDDGSPNVYLPPEENTTFLTVKRAIAADAGALAFLKGLGLKRPDVIAEVRAKVLPKYDRWDSATNAVVPGPGPASNEENGQDVRKILRAFREVGWADRETLENEILARAWVRAAIASDGSTVYFFPRLVYVRRPELELYFKDNGCACFLADDYSPDERDMLCTQTWLCRQVRIDRRQPDYRGYVPLTTAFGKHSRGVDGFDPDCQIDGLEHALQTITREKAAFIWNGLLLPNWKSLRGVVESSTRQTFAEPRREERLSPAGTLVTTLRWLPDRSGALHPPSELLPDELPDEFQCSEDLALALQMRSPPELGQIARDLGVNEEDIDFLRKHREAFAQFRKEFEERQAWKVALDGRAKATAAPSRNEERTQPTDGEPPPHTIPPADCSTQRSPAPSGAAKDAEPKPSRRPPTPADGRTRPGARIDAVELFDGEDEERLKWVEQADRERAGQEGSAPTPEGDRQGPDAPAAGVRSVAAGRTTPPPGRSLRDLRWLRWGDAEGGHQLGGDNQGGRPAPQCEQRLLGALRGEGLIGHLRPGHLRRDSQPDRAQYRCDALPGRRPGQARELPRIPATKPQLLHPRQPEAVSGPPRLSTARPSAAGIPEGLLGAAPGHSFPLDAEGACR